jgi:hypothetical protein
MDKQIPFNSLAIVGGVFGVLLLGMLLSEWPGRWGSGPGSATTPAPAAQPTQCATRSGVCG